jgi:hypothetical protein
MFSDRFLLGNPTLLTLGDKPALSSNSFHFPALGNFSAEASEQLLLRFVFS